MNPQRLAFVRGTKGTNLHEVSAELAQVVPLALLALNSQFPQQRFKHCTGHGVALGGAPGVQFLARASAPILPANHR